MKIAWVSHQWPRLEDAPESATPGLLPGRWAGGAEFQQEQMRLAAPDGVEFVSALPGSPDLLDVCRNADRIVVASPESLEPGEADDLSTMRPDLVWVMTVQPSRSLPILEAARTLAWQSSKMREWHPWAPEGDVVGAYIPTAEIPCRGKRNGRALWAARNHPLKGRLNARIWALDHKIELDEITDAPREDVLAAMAVATYFVHRPIERDPCPSTVTEALIAGCDVVTNERVGRIPADSRDSAIEYVESMPATFYGFL